MMQNLSSEKAKMIEARNKKLDCFNNSMVENNLFYKPIYKLNTSVSYT